MKNRQDKLTGPVVSLPTFVDNDHNLETDKQRKHIRWLMENGIGVDGNGVLLIAVCGGGEGRVGVRNEKTVAPSANLSVQFVICPLGWHCELS